MKNFDIDKIILQNILHSVDEGIHVIDNEGKTIMYNDVMAELEGLEKEIVLNKTFSDIFPSLDEESSTLFTVMKTGRPIVDRSQTYYNYKGQKISTINTTIPLFYKGEKIGAIEIAKDITKLRKLSEKLYDLQRELSQNKVKENIKKEVPKYTFDTIIGNSQEIKSAIEIARRSSNSSSSVLIYGETGTGKELFSQSIHYEGDRRNKPFIAQNCAALPESLLEGLLFGTSKGGFTGAIDRPGLFEQANGGTLLLDEINSMGLSLQAKLLRVLQEGYIRRVGGLKDIPIDVKIIATTNEDPKLAIAEGRLRKDLYYRINVISIEIPPLRMRSEDIKLLCDSFIKKYNKKLNKNVKDISKEVLLEFNNYSWPGNVRELEGFIEGAMNYITQEIHTLMKHHFPFYLENNKDLDFRTVIDFAIPLPDTLNALEEKIIKKALKESNNNISRAAELLKIKRQTLQHKMKKFNFK